MVRIINDGRRLACLLALVALAGCSSGDGVQEGDAENLRKISVAYTRATDKLGRPPRDAADLKPFLAKDEDLENLFRSPNDGQPYVILWGTDPRTGRTRR